MTAPSTPLLQACDRRDLLGATPLYPNQRRVLAGIDAGPRIHVLNLGRRSGKTYMAALAMLHNLLLSPHLDQMVREGEQREAVFVATTQRQAQIALKAARSIVEASPILKGMVERVTSDEITFSNGTTLAAIACSSAGARGRPISAMTMDEAHFFLSDTDGDATADAVWEALVPSTAQFGDHSLVLVLSTPNKRLGPTGFFHDIYARANAGGIPEAKAHHATTEEMNPTVPKAFLEAEGARDPENYRCEYLAEFVTGGLGAFFDVRDLEFAEGPADVADLRGPVTVGLDPAFHGDHFGVAVVARSVEDRDVLRVGALAGIEPGARLRTQEQRRRREDDTLRQVLEILEPYKQLGIQAFTDQHEVDAIQSFFGHEGIQVEMVKDDSPWKTAAFVATRQRLKDGTLQLWRHEPLLGEMRRVRTARLSEAIKLGRGDGGHGDICVALCRAVAQFRHDREARIEVPPENMRIPQAPPGRGSTDAGAGGVVSPKGTWLPSKPHTVIPRGTPAFQRRIAARQLRGPPEGERRAPTGCTH
jgi:Terminase large subunit, T4likevirus-type, N-terminal